MYTYIKKNIPGNFITVKNQLSSNQMGSVWNDYMKNMYLLLNDAQIQFKAEHPDATPREVWFMKLITPPTPIRTLADAKRELNEKIKAYDLSDNVNIFYVGEDPIWLDKDTRAGLKLRFDAELSAGDEYTTLWYGTKKYTLPLNVAGGILLIVEKYASQCYDNTQSHYAAVEKLNTIAEVDSYDYTTGYPEKLCFML